MERRGLNKRGFARDSGIPYTTIVSFYKNGYSNTKLSTIICIADFFGVSIDYLVRDDMEEIEYTAKHKDETDDLDDHGKRFVKMVVEHEKERMAEIEKANEDRDYLLPGAARPSITPLSDEDNDLDELAKKN